MPAIRPVGVERRLLGRGWAGEERQSAHLHEVDGVAVGEAQLEEVRPGKRPRMSTRSVSRERRGRSGVLQVASRQSRARRVAVARRGSQAAGGTADEVGWGGRQSWAARWAGFRRVVGRGRAGGSALGPGAPLVPVAARTPVLVGRSPGAAWVAPARHQDGWRGNQRAAGRWPARPAGAPRWSARTVEGAPRPGAGRPRALPPAPGPAAACR